MPPRPDFFGFRPFEIARGRRGAAVSVSVDSAGERVSARETGPALEAHYRFLLWLVPAVERFPRRQKFLLGDRIQSTALDVLDSLIEATYTKPIWI